MRRVLTLAAALVCGIVPVLADDGGREVFDRLCSHCHAPGVEHPATRQLAVTRGEDKAVLAERRDLAAEYIRYVVRNGLKSMPGFYPSDLTEAQLESLVEYLSP
jgi:mono/diheme cytochrome c family protein